MEYLVSCQGKLTRCKSVNKGTKAQAEQIKRYLRQVFENQKLQTTYLCEQEKNSIYNKTQNNIIYRISTPSLYRSQMNKYTVNNIKPKFALTPMKNLRSESLKQIKQALQSSKIQGIQIKQQMQRNKKNKFQEKSMKFLNFSKFAYSYKAPHDYLVKKKTSFKPKVNKSRKFYIFQ